MEEFGSIDLFDTVVEEYSHEGFSQDSLSVRHFIIVHERFPF